MWLIVHYALFVWYGNLQWQTKSTGCITFYKAEFISNESPIILKLKYLSSSKIIWHVYFYLFIYLFFVALKFHAFSDAEKFWTNPYLEKKKKKL